MDSSGASSPAPTSDAPLAASLGIGHAAAVDGRIVYGFNRGGVDEVRERASVLRELCREAGRDIAALSLAVALEQGQPRDVGGLAEAGIGELVLVEAPPDDPAAVADWVEGLAKRWNSAIA